jgi:hypothetical protein
VRDRDGHALQKPKRDEALLSVAETIIFEGGRQPGKDLGSIGEIDLVSGEIQRPLAFVPGEPHLRSVYTAGGTVKA